MNKLTLSEDCALNGLRGIHLENRFLEVTVLPDAGARIWQIAYKPLGTEILWNNPGVAPQCQPLHASYDDTWSGGWDELFPNDEAGTIEGMAFPDHGELWTGAWRDSPWSEDGVAGLHLEFTTPLSQFKAEKTLLLRPESAVLEMRYRMTNMSARRFPFLWKLHPAFAVSPQHRIDFPAMRVVLEPEFAGTLEGAPASFEWPYVTQGGTVTDLRQVPDVSAKATHFFYGTELAAGWCGVTNRANKLAAGLRFDPEVFSSCWLFASHGGWRDLNVAVLEPATGYPFKMQSMVEAGRARTLAPRESLETTVLLSVQEGLRSIGGVEADGRILPGYEA